MPTHAPSPLFASMLVAVGGGTGAVMRFQLGRAVARLFPSAGTAFPWATLTANGFGSAAMGLLIGWLALHDSPHGGQGWQLLLGVGLLGGFTTFSSFSMETVLLWQRGEPGLAICYVAVSLLLGFAGLVFGLLVARMAL